MSDLKAAARLGARWTTLSSIVSAGTQVLRMSIMAHFFLSPVDFGHFAVVTAVIMILLSITDLGLVMSVLRTPTMSKHKAASFLYTTLFSGVVLAGALTFAAPSVARIFGDAAISGLLRPMGLILILESASSVLIALQERDLNFRGPALAEILSAGFGFFASITFAIAGYGIWSLVFGQLIQSAAKLTYAFFLSGKLVAFTAPASYGEIHSDAKFSGFVFADRLVNTLFARSDQILLGALSTAQQVGFYAVNYNYSVGIVYRVNSPLGRVLYPLISKASNSGDRAGMARAFLLTLQIVAMVNGAFCAALFAVAPSFVPVMLGPRWLAAVPILRLLCVAAILKAVLNLSGLIILNVGRSATQFYWNLAVITVSLPITALLALRHGAAGAALAIILVEVASLVPVYLIMIRPHIEASALAVAKAFALPLFGSACSAAAVMAAGYPFAPGLRCLIVQMLVGALCFPVLAVLSAPRASYEVASWVLGSGRLDAVISRSKPFLGI